MSYNPALDPRDEREQQHQNAQATKDNGVNRLVTGTYSNPAIPVGTSHVTNTEVVVPGDLVRWGANPGWPVFRTGNSFNFKFAGSSSWTNRCGRRP